MGDTGNLITNTKIIDEYLAPIMNPRFENVKVRNDVAKIRAKALSRKRRLTKGRMLESGY